MKDWFTGNGKTIAFENILELIAAHAKNKGKICIGTDSFVKKSDCIFSMAICLYGAEGQNGGRYFINRTVSNKSLYPTMLQRIILETQKSIDLGTRLLRASPKLEIEIHLDVSPASKNNGTSRFADMLVGYAKGAGFAYKVKPDSFAAMSIADKHSK
jgi:predicted RNase H-related nuclease YkuK (DUF458 family)